MESYKELLIEYLKESLTVVLFVGTFILIGWATSYLVQFNTNLSNYTIISAMVFGFTALIVRMAKASGGD